MSLSSRVLDKIRFFGQFGDVAPLWEDVDLRREIIDALEGWVSSLEEKNIYVDKIVGIEARGFMLGAVLADRLHLPFAWVRSGGKLHEGLNPLRATCVDYSGERKALEVSKDHFKAGENVLIVDDWFETGRQAMTSARLLKDCGVNVVGFCTIVDDTSSYEDTQEFLSRYHYYYIVKK